MTTVQSAPTVTFVDLASQHAEIEHDVEEGLRRVMDACAFVNGPDVAVFESAWAGYCGRSHALGVANGTDALELALRAAGVGTGDEVVVPANSFIASAEAVARTGASVRLVDCDPLHLLIDADLIAEARTGADPGGTAGAPVRSDRPHGGCGGRCGSWRADGRRGRGTGPRGAPAWPTGRQLGSGRRIQLLPREEPRRLWRRWRRSDRRRRSGHRPRCAAQPWQSGALRAPDARVQLSPRHRPGRGPQREAGAPGRMERQRAGGQPPATRICFGDFRACDSRPPRSATSTCGTSMSSACPSGTAALPRCRRPGFPLPSTTRRPSI